MNGFVAITEKLAFLEQIFVFLACDFLQESSFDRELIPGRKVLLTAWVFQKLSGTLRTARS